MFFTVNDVLRADRYQELLLNLLSVFSQFLMGIVILGCKVIVCNKTCTLYQCLKCLTDFYMKPIKWQRKEQCPFSCLVGKYTAFGFNCRSCTQLFQLCWPLMFSSWCLWHLIWEKDCLKLMSQCFKMRAKEVACHCHCGWLPQLHSNERSRASQSRAPWCWLKGGEGIFVAIAVLICNCSAHPDTQHWKERTARMQARCVSTDILYLSVSDCVIINPHLRVHVLQVPLKAPALQSLSQSNSFRNVSKVNSRVLQSRKRIKKSHCTDFMVAISTEIKLEFILYTKLYFPLFLLLL